MDTNLDTNLITELETPNFGTEVAKSFAITAATTAGMLTGLAIFGAVRNKIVDRRKIKQDQKAPNTPVE